MLTRVPLLVSGLDVSEAFDAGRSSSRGGPQTGGSDRDRTPVSLVDVAPTLADAAGLDRDPDAGVEADGVSLLDGVPEDRTVLVESARYGYEKKAAYARGYKLVASRGDDYAEGFSVPDEESVELPAGVESDLRDALPAFPGEDSTAPRRERDASPSRSVERRLADLGYR
ncbi:hypothetical protein [Halorussus sp. MSC15.2]|uniref:hypothetical protein n=1 Tax=Halorussus sp. MSC15.2 TaxID=2283638 RepID=UPI0013D7C4AA|nr:hypothetical protein [Halorussus sp. MSC15.2]NEU56572.1 hypothetical protein [Halorussus sp. MSC15.2]